MMKILYKSVTVTALLTLVLCGAYPLVVFALGQIFFAHLANGSLVEKEGKVVGSRLIGQTFSRPEYFHGRPSAAGETGYDATSSSGSNLGPTSQKLIKAVEASIRALVRDNPGVDSRKVPVDLVTSSGSGLDPHISPEAAEVQVARVARARGVSPERVRELIRKHTASPQLGFLGESVVNVLELNLDLEKGFVR